MTRICCRSGITGVSLGATLTALLALSACAAAPAAEAEQRFTGWAGVVEEFDETLAHFPEDHPLPEGVDFHPSLDDLVEGPASDTELYERGNGLGHAYKYWECAWMTVALESPAGAARDEALAMLHRGLDSELRKNYVDDPDNVWENDVLSAAELGDFSLFSEFYASGCS